MDSEQDKPLPLDYASPRIEPAVPAGQIVIEFLSGCVLLVLAAMFVAGAAVNLLQRRTGVVAWVLAVIYLLAGLTFAWGGVMEIHRAIRHQRRR